MGQAKGLKISALAITSSLISIKAGVGSTTLRRLTTLAIPACLTNQPDTSMMQSSSQPPNLMRMVDPMFSMDHLMTVHHVFGQLSPSVVCQLSVQPILLLDARAANLVPHARSGA